MRRPFPLLVLALALLAAAGCGEEAERGHPEPGRSPDHAVRPHAAAWDEVSAAAQGQTVRWWMFGGDERINRYVDEEVAPRAEELGVTIERVPVDDTASVVQRVAAEFRAGETEGGGGVDLIWINGENFAEGKEAGLWLEDWASALPNAELVDWEDPTVAQDFGVPVEGQESPWSRAVFVFAYDEARTPDPPRTYEELATYAAENPGRITYPAPPDFTGGAFVRQVVQALGEDAAFELLLQMKPDQWREGRSFPTNEAELNQLFGNGQVDLAMSYDPSFVASGVRQGTFPETARPYTFESGALQNVSYVTIPANAANREGALVVANLLLDPELQALKADPDGLGIPTVLDLGRLDPEQRELFSETAGDSPYHLVDYGKLLSELPPTQVVELEERWQEEVLR
ncbi:MAG: ABC transporter substrate-binding protein [Nitriliruptorales bacterium]|nr:ABC transporter substrate-binding protein [Nitriliruptorales bacterium]